VEIRMIVCFPMNEKENYLELLPFAHFGSAEYFVIYNTDNDQNKIIESESRKSGKNACNPLMRLNPLMALKGESVEVFVVNGIGENAMKKFNEIGIKVLKASEGITVEKHIELIKNHMLTEFPENLACKCQDCYQCK